MCGDATLCQLPGGELGRSDVAYGSTAASRFADPHVRLLSFDLDREAADIRENPVPASCSLRIDQEIGMSMTGIKVQRS